MKGRSRRRRSPLSSRTSRVGVRLARQGLGGGRVRERRGGRRGRRRPRLRAPGGGGGGGAAVEPAEGDDEKLELDMPPSWVAKLNIPRARYEGRTPAGMKATLYRKARLEKFAAYSLDSGMVERLTVFADALCLQPVEVRAAAPRRPLRSPPFPPPPPPLTRPSPRPPRGRFATRTLRRTSWPSGSSSRRRRPPSNALTPGGPRGCASTCSSRA